MTNAKGLVGALILGLTLTLSPAFAQSSGTSISVTFPTGQSASGTLGSYILPKTMQVSLTGTGSATAFTVTSDKPWLVISGGSGTLTPGGAAKTVYLQFQNYGFSPTLGAGTHTAKVRINVAGAGNSPVEKTITLTLTSATSSGTSGATSTTTGSVSINTSFPSGQSRTSVQGSSILPLPMQVRLTGSGASKTFSVTSDKPWLTVSGGSGTLVPGGAAKTVYLQFQTYLVSPAPTIGTNTAKVRITVSGVANSPVEKTITLTLTSASSSGGSTSLFGGTGTVSSGSGSGSGTAGALTVSPTTFTINNAVQGTGTIYGAPINLVLGHATGAATYYSITAQDPTLVTMGTGTGSISASQATKTVTLFATAAGRSPGSHATAVYVRQLSGPGGSVVATRSVQVTVNVVASSGTAANASSGAIGGSTSNTSAPTGTQPPATSSTTAPAPIVTTTTGPTVAPAGSPIRITYAKQRILDNSVSTEIPEGASFRAYGLKIRIKATADIGVINSTELEVRPIGQAFTGTRTTWDLGGSTGVNVDTEMQVYPPAAGAYHWQVRVNGSAGSTGWVEFGAPGNTDFILTAISGLNVGLISTPTTTTPVAPANSGIAASVGSLIFSAPAGSNPAPQSFQITNQGSASRDVTLLARGFGSNAAWASVTPGMDTIGAGASRQVIVDVASAALTAGSYSCTIDVTDASGALLRSVPVSLSVNAGAAMSLSSTSLTFNAPVGGPNAAAQMITVSNTGAGTLSFTASDNRSWLSISPASGSLASGQSATLSVTTDVAGLSIGAETGTITFSAAGVADRFVTATLNVNGTPTLQLSDAEVLFTMPKGGLNPAPARLKLQNVGNGMLSWTAKKDAAWLTVSKLSGSLDAAKEDVVSLSVDGKDLAAGVHTTTIEFAGASIPQTVTVKFQISDEAALTAASAGSASTERRGHRGSRCGLVGLDALLVLGLVALGRRLRRSRT